MRISATIQSPCQGCEDRCIGCHTTCGDYAVYKAELEKVRQMQKAESESIEFSKAVKGACIKRAKRKRK